MNDWITAEDGTEYKYITINGLWEVIRFRGNAALYSFCTNCGYLHPCYKNHLGSNFAIEYAPEKEFNYCPMCGTKMLEDCYEPILQN